MVIHSPMSKKEYLESLQENMGGHYDFGSDRFTGFFIGSCFYVTHHAGYEWNRRYSNQKNAAMGYVKETEEGCVVRFIRFRGAMCPLVFIPLFLSLGLILTISAVLNGITGIAAILLPWILAFATSAVTAPITAFIESLTQQGEEGRRALLSMLLNPSDPYKNYRKIP